jgi:hypothetical protein
LIATKNSKTSKNEKEHYSILISSGQSKNVGDTYLSLYGTKANIERFHLKENILKKKPFVSGSSDEFELNGPDVGNV